MTTNTTTPGLMRLPTEIRQEILIYACFTVEAPSPPEWHKSKRTLQVCSAIDRHIRKDMVYVVKEVMREFARDFGRTSITGNFLGYRWYHDEYDAAEHALDDNRRWLFNQLTSLLARPLDEARWLLPSLQVQEEQLSKWPERRILLETDELERQAEKRFARCLRIYQTRAPYSEAEDFQQDGHLGKSLGESAYLVTDGR